ncbi:MAG: hypothetical protein U1E43_10390 [Rhodospirillales bacterium]
MAALLETDGDGRIAHAAVAVGSCSEVAQRLPALEQALTGWISPGSRCRRCWQRSTSPRSPLTDVRGTAEYRLEAARLLVGRALDELQERLRRATTLRR